MRVQWHKMLNATSKVENHVHKCHHQMDFDNVQVWGMNQIFTNDFLSAWMSIKDMTAGNDHVVTPEDTLKRHSL